MADTIFLQVLVRTTPRTYVI